MSSHADTPTPPELEPFLFAEIGKEDNGMALTVASAFARLGLDPWDQAALLARLSDGAATASLAALLGRLPFGSGGDALPIASRLVPLLPKPADPPDARVASPAKRRASRAVWLLWATVAATAVYMIWF